MKLCRPRCFDNCWLACILWKQLGLDEYWQERIDELRGDIEWSKVIKLLVVNCLVKPASEFYVHRQWLVPCPDSDTICLSMLSCNPYPTIRPLLSY